MRPPRVSTSAMASLFNNPFGCSNAASSNCHSTQVKVEKRYPAGLSLLSAYTWSKLIDNINVDSQGTVQQFLNPNTTKDIGCRAGVSRLLVILV
jgi:hypothetical protein